MTGEHYCPHITDEETKTQEKKEVTWSNLEYPRRLISDSWPLDLEHDQAHCLSDYVCVNLLQQQQQTNTTSNCIISDIWSFNKCPTDAKLWDPLLVTIEGETEAKQIITRSRESCYHTCTVWCRSTEGAPVVLVCREGRCGGDGASWTLWHCRLLKEQELTFT